MYVNDIYHSHKRMVIDNCTGVIRTLSGKIIHPESPNPEDFELADIAHLLCSVQMFPGEIAGNKQFSLLRHTLNRYDLAVAFGLSPLSNAETLKHILFYDVVDAIMSCVLVARGLEDLYDDDVPFQNELAACNFRSALQKRFQIGTSPSKTAREIDEILTKCERFLLCSNYTRDEEIVYESNKSHFVNITFLSDKQMKQRWLELVANCDNYCSKSPFRRRLSGWVDGVDRFLSSFGV